MCYYLYHFNEYYLYLGGYRYMYTTVQRNKKLFLFISFFYFKTLRVSSSFFFSFPLFSHQQTSKFCPRGRGSEKCWFDLKLFTRGQLGTFVDKKIHRSWPFDLKLISALIYAQIWLQADFKLRGQVYANTKRESTPPPYAHIPHTTRQSSSKQQTTTNTRTKKACQEHQHE